MVKNIIEILAKTDKEPDMTFPVAAIALRCILLAAY